MRCLHPYTTPEGVTVPCGRCLQCRIQRRKEWSIRLLHELSVHDKSVFITLTYREEKLPENGSLRKSDLQKFFKRLRRRLANESRFMRYFACGEYGSQSYRPHYHALLFGVGINKADKELVMDSWQYCDWTQKSIRKNSFGLVEPQSINYVCGYIHDKLSGMDEKFIYEDTGRENVFRLGSQGLGKNFCDENADQIQNNGYIQAFGTKINVPRYYIKRLGYSTQELKAKRIEREKEENFNNFGLELTNDEIYLSQKSEVVRSIDIAKKNSNVQNDKNLKAKLKLKKGKL